MSLCWEPIHCPNKNCLKRCWGRWLSSWALGRDKCAVEIAPHWDWNNRICNAVGYWTDYHIHAFQRFL